MRKKDAAPPVDITKKICGMPKRAKNRGNNGDEGIHRQINVSNSNTFHIPASNCLLCVFDGPISLEKDCKCQSVLEDFMGDVPHTYFPQRKYLL